jgi:hypothetical protein
MIAFHIVRARPIVLRVIFSEKPVPTFGDHESGMIVFESSIPL